MRIRGVILDKCTNKNALSVSQIVVNNSKIPF